MADEKTAEATDMNPRRFYDDLGEGEWERLDENPVARLEFENTTDYLADRLPDSGRVLDAGGGPGRYTCWLANRGYEVEHCDLSAEQVRIAREKVDERGVGDRATCRRADVRDLPFSDDAFDAVCCLGGVLSHVLDADERERAIRELRRVARSGIRASEASAGSSERSSDGGPVFVSVIGRLSSIRFGVKHGERFGLLEHLAETGDYTQEAVAELADGEGWAECHFFRADEFEVELESAGLDVETLAGLEGPASQLQEELSEADEEELADVREMVKNLREDRSVVDTSEHILAVCRA